MLWRDKRVRMCALILGIETVLAATAVAHSGGPRPAFTGGFQEATCTRCHTTYPVDAGRRLGGAFAVEGVPARYEPGRTYLLTVRISHPGQVRWGFQLAVRYADSQGQAGVLAPVDAHAQLKEASGIQYAEHTERGTREDHVDGPVEFLVNWTAPEAPGTVVFNAAGNAADGSGDPLGDYIYTAGAFSRAEVPEGEILTAVPAKERPRRRLNTASRLVHLPAPVDLDRGDMEIHIEHRWQQSVEDSRAGNAFGLDGPANIHLGFNYALTDRISVGVSRVRFGRTVTFSGTGELWTGDRWPVRVSLVGGVEGRENFRDHYSPFFQLAGDVDWGRVRFYAVPTLVLNSRRDAVLPFFPDPINPDHNATFSLGVGADAMLTPSLSLVTEFIPRLAGFGGFGPEHPAISAAVKLNSWGHVFTVGISTSRTFTPSEYAVNNVKDYSLGFNVYRRLR